jgi:hypothetical protein
MKRTPSCETFRKADRNTLPSLPTIPEERLFETQVLLLEQTIEEILSEYHAPILPKPIRYSFLEVFLQQVDCYTTRILNERFTD